MIENLEMKYVGKRGYETKLLSRCMQYSNISSLQAELVGLSSLSPLVRTLHSLVTRIP